jgi:hypothetical protein
MSGDAASRVFDQLPLAERDVHEILERAAAIDEQRARAVTVAELRDIAREAGISDEAFAQALREFQSSSAPSHRRLARRTDEGAWLPDVLAGLARPGWGRSGGLAVGGFALGGFIRAFGEYGLHNLFALVLIAVFSLTLAIDNGQRGSQASFQMELLHTWFGFAVGWSFLNGAVLGEMAAVTATLWLGLAIAGGLLVAFLSSLGAGEKETPERD